MSIGYVISDDQIEYSIFPYAEYSSNIANKTKRIVSLGNNCILGGLESFSIQYDLETNILTIDPGKCIIGDVLIETISPINIDLTDNENFLIDGNINTFGNGYYYLCIDYTYAKSRPHPKASFILIPPTVREAYTPNASSLIIKVLEIEDLDIINYYDQDSEYPLHFRQSPKIFTEIYNHLPTFNQSTDLCRFICVHDKENLEATYYVGLLEDWARLNLRIETGSTVDLIVGDHFPLPTDWDYNKGTIWYNQDLATPENYQLYILIDNLENNASWRNINLTQVSNINPDYYLHKGSGDLAFWLNNISGELNTYIKCSNFETEFGVNSQWGKLRRNFSTNMDFYLDPTNGDDTNIIPLSDTPFKTMPRMIEYLDGFNISDGVKVTINIPQGSHIITDTFNISHPDGDKIEIIGPDVQEKTITIVQISEPGKVQLHFESLEEGDIEAGDYILINDVEFVDMALLGIFPEYDKQSYILPGCYLVDSVDHLTNTAIIIFDVPLDKGNNTVTMPNGTFECQCCIIKTIITSQCSFLEVNNDNKLLSLRNLVLIGRNVTNEYCISVPYQISNDDVDLLDLGKNVGGKISYIENIGIRNFGIGIICSSRSFIRGRNIGINNCQEGAILESGILMNLSISGCTGDKGLYIRKGYVEIFNCFISGCSSIGCLVSNGSSLYTQRLISSNNNDIGIIVESNSSFVTSNYNDITSRHIACHAINNKNHGILCKDNGLFSCNLSHCFHNGVVGFFASDGGVINSPLSKAYYNDFGYFAEEGSVINCEQNDLSITAIDPTYITENLDLGISYINGYVFPSLSANIPSDDWTCYENSICGIYAENNSIVNAINSILISNGYAVQAWKGSNIDVSHGIVCKKDTDSGDFLGIMSIQNSLVTFYRGIAFNVDMSCYSQQSIISAEYSMTKDCDFAYYADNGIIDASYGSAFNNLNNGITGINSSNIYAQYFTTFNLPPEEFESYETLSETEKGNGGWGIYLDSGSKGNCENSCLFGNDLGGLAVINNSFCLGDSSKIYFNGGTTEFSCYINFNSSALLRYSNIYENNPNKPFCLVFKNSYLSLVGSIVDGATGAEGVLAHESSVIDAENIVIKNCLIGLKANILSYIFADGANTDDNVGTPFSPTGVLTAGNYNSYINR